MLRVAGVVSDAQHDELEVNEDIEEEAMNVNQGTSAGGRSSAPGIKGCL